jgi:hypothetical protein
MLVKCLYCDADNDGLSTGGFCESCGKKLPSSAMLKTRRTMGGDAPEGPVERAPIPRKSKAVSEGLFGAAIVHLFAGGLFLVVGSLFFSKVPDHFASHVLSWALLPTMAVAVLGVLARWMPMPAVLLAILFVPVWAVLTFVVNPALAVGWLLVDVALLAMLLWVMWLGLRPEKQPGG